MDARSILERIEGWIAAQNADGKRVSVTSLSNSASSQAIRNWQRALASGQTPGVTMASIQKLAKAMKVSETWLATGDGVETIQTSRDPIDDELDAEVALLTPTEKRYLLAAARGYRAQRLQEGD